MIDFNKKIKNSDKFREAALMFQKTGMYTTAPKGTTEYIRYWEQEMARCVDGYIAEDGDFISGYNYFYLNYCPIVRREWVEVKNKRGDIILKSRDTRTFPDFYDYDYFFFQGIEEAETVGKHMVVAKSRRKGYSYKASSMCCRNFYLIPDSKSYVYASNRQYLTDDGILTKAWEYMDFIDEYTAWGKKRHVANTALRRRASFIITDQFGNKTEAGYKSEIIGATIKDNPDIVRGKRGKLIVWEEAGSSPELSAAWQIARPSVEQDGVAFGLMLAFGTGGDEGTAIQGLKNAFYDPDSFNCIGFPNIWDDGNPDKLCGFFVPQYTNLDIRDENGNRLYMDDDGNTITNAASAYILGLRQKELENATDTRSIDRYIAERCISPMEAFMELTGNIFPKKDLQIHLANIRTNRKLQNHKQVGDLIWDNGKVVWHQKKTGDLTRYKLSPTDDPTGSIVIWEHPVKDAPFGLYISGCLLPGEKVIVDDGQMVNIEEIKSHNKLLDKDGNFVDVKAYLKYWKNDEDVFEIGLSNTYRTTTFTKEHPIYISKHPLNKQNLVTEELFKFGFKKVSELGISDWTRYPNIYYNPSIKKLEIIQEELLWFYGLWLGDGWFEKKNEIHIIFNKTDKTQIARLEYLISNHMGYKFRKRIRNNTVNISFKDSKLRFLLESLFGKGANGKYVANSIKYSTSYEKALLLSGYLDSDGCICKNNKDYYSTEFVSCNLELIEHIQDIAFSIGLVGNISKMREAGETTICDIKTFQKEAYHLRFGHNDTIKFAQMLNFDYRTKFSKIDKENIKQTRVRPKDGCFISSDNKYIYFQIRNIDRKKYTGWVYNFETETHTFCGHHIATHNCDPYDHDISGTNSLGSVFIYKRFQNFEEYYDLLVAEYTGRPSNAEEFYENVRKLLTYYNAVCLTENQNKGIITYFKQKHSEHLLADQPDIISNIVGASKVQRAKGIHMTNQIKDAFEGWIKDWLNEEYAPGKKNLTKILSEPLLEELINYNRKGNFDRCLVNDSVIYTKDGFKEISEIEIGDEVLSHDGKFNTVTITDESDRIEDLYEIRQNGNTIPLICTSNHPLLVAKSKINKHSRRNDSINNISWQTPEMLIEDNSRYKFLFAPKRNITKKSTYSDDFLYLLGWCLADGSITNNQIRIVFQLNQECIADKISNIIWKYTKDKKTKGSLTNKFPTKKIVKTKTGGWIEISKTNKYLADILKDLGVVSYKKHICSELYNTNNLMPLVIGYLEGDGHQKKNANYDGYDRNILECSTIYKYLIFQIRQILLDNGIWSSLSVKYNHGFNGKSKDCQDMYNINISSKYLTKLLSYYPSLKYSLPKTENRDKNIQIETNDGFWVPLKSIKKSKRKDKKVYNLEVENTHNYVANGIVNHNCISLGCVMIYLQQLHNVNVKNSEDETRRKRVFDVPLFSAQYWNDQVMYDDTDYARTSLSSNWF